MYVKITQIHPLVFKVAKCDLKENMGKIYYHINKEIQQDKAVAIIGKKSDRDINGCKGLIEGLRWDDKKYSLIVVKIVNK